MFFAKKEHQHGQDNVHLLDSAVSGFQRVANEDGREQCEADAHGGGSSKNRAHDGHHMHDILQYGLLLIPILTFCVAFFLNEQHHIRMTAFTCPRAAHIKTDLIKMRSAMIALNQAFIFVSTTFNENESYRARTNPTVIKYLRIASDKVNEAHQDVAG